MVTPSPTQEEHPCPTPHAPWSSSTACGCTRPRGSPGSSSSTEPATPPSRPAGPATRRPSRPRAAHPEAIADHGIDDVVEHYLRIFERLDRKPILVGHSFGGMIAEKLLGMDAARRGHRHRCGADQGRAAPAPVVAPSDLAGVQEPRQQAQGRLADGEQFRYSFGNAVSEEESDQLYERGPSPHPASRCSRRPPRTSPCTRPPKVTPTTTSAGRFSWSWAARTTQSPRRSRGRRSSSTATPRGHGLLEFEDRGHSLTIDSGWRTSPRPDSSGSRSRGCAATREALPRLPGLRRCTRQSIRRSLRLRGSLDRAALRRCDLLRCSMRNGWHLVRAAELAEPMGSDLTAECLATERRGPRADPRMRSEAWVRSRARLHARVVGHSRRLEVPGQRQERTALSR